MNESKGILFDEALVKERKGCFYMVDDDPKDGPRLFLTTLEVLCA